MQDSDGDGLTDAYEQLVSHTNPNNWDSDGDGISDGAENSPSGLPWTLERARKVSAVIFADNPNTTEGGSCGECTFYLPALAPAGGAIIQYRVTGSAALNTDFTTTPTINQIVVPAGSTSASLSVCAVNDTTYSDLPRYAIFTLTNRVVSIRRNQQNKTDS